MHAPSKIPILIVDDYPANLLALGAVLDEDVYEIFEATSGAKALEIARSRDIGLIILDIQMPEMDGYEVARRIRADPRTRDVPIIFVTAVYRDDPAVRQGYLAGGQDYLGKPFDPDVLKAKVAIYSNLFIRTLQVERQKIELEKGTDHYRQIVEGAHEIMATLDVHGTVITLNLAFERLTGFRCDDWIGKSFHPLLEGDVQQLHTALGAQGLDDTAQLIRVALRRAEGGGIPIEISVQPLVEDGQRVGTIGVMRDISRRVGG